jgi:Protein of unknown function (DUF669)
VTTLNWQDLQKAAGEAGFDPVPPAEYDVAVEAATVKSTSNGDKQMIATTFVIEGGAFDKKKIFNQFVISPDNPNALAFFFRHMSALGLGETYFASNPPLERVAGDLVGKRCRVKVSTRTWNDTQRNQVDSVLPPLGPQNAASAGSFQAPPVPSPGAPVSPMPPVPSPAVPAPPVPTPSTTPPPPPDDSDLPF